MKRILTLTAALFSGLISHAQGKAEWVSSSQQAQWVLQSPLSLTNTPGKADAEVLLSKPKQTIEGFGSCFNELGWTSLSLLSAKDRDAIFKELYAPGAGANFVIGRMPVGANDFSRQWYSYNETAEDFAMENFSIANDTQTLIPFIKTALQYNPQLKLWASPWSPPSWMKYNKHYAARSVLGNSNFQSDEWGMDLRGINNGLPESRQGFEGTNMFVQNEPYFKAYALYFQKFIEAYREQGIRISMVMPQNEFNSAQVFPSCTWTAAGLANFVAHLGPQMKKMGVDLFLGTMERGNFRQADTILKDPRCKPYISGMGFQWAGKGAIPAIHQAYPQLTLYQTEQECGNGKNDWTYCVYAWSLLKHYLSNGANAYLYWNTCLKQGGISTWGWKQNSLISVDTVNKTYQWNYEYYLMKHISHFVQPGAKRLETTGELEELLAFQNPDKSIVVVMYNDKTEEREFTLKAGARWLKTKVAGASFHTFVFR